MSDHDLGMDRPIARRDFLNGVAVTGSLLSNHDDFGGHATRNEFRHEERSLNGVIGQIETSKMGIRS